MADPLTEAPQMPRALPQGGRSLKEGSVNIKREPGTVGDVVIGGGSTFLDVSVESSQIIGKPLQTLITRAKTYPNAQLPDTLTFAAGAYKAAYAVQEYGDRSELASGTDKSKPVGEKPFWTSRELGEAYFAIVQTLRADLAYMAAEVNPRDSTLVQRIQSVLLANSTSPTIQKMLRRMTTEYQGRYVQENRQRLHSEMASLTGFDKLDRNRQIRELDELTKGLQEVLKVMGISENGDPLNSLRTVTRDRLGGTEGINVFNNFIVEEIIGSNELFAKGREGIFAREKYRERLGGRDFERLSKTEQIQFWDSLSPIEQDEILYDATELAVGDWADTAVEESNIALKYQQEAGKDIFTPDMLSDAQASLDRLETSEKVDTQREKDEADNLVTDLTRRVDETKTRRDKIRDTEMSAAAAKLKQAIADRTRDLPAARAKQGLKTTAHATAVSEFNTADTAYNTAVTLLESGARAAIAGGADATETNAQLEKDKTAKATALNLTGLKNKVTAAEAELEQANLVIATINGKVDEAQSAVDELKKESGGLTSKLGGKNGLESKLKEARKKQDEFKKLAIRGAEQMSPEALAITATIQMALEGNYNKIVRDNFREDQRDLADTSIDPATGVCRGIQELRRRLFRNLKDKEGKPGVAYDATRAEMQLSEYDALQGYIKAFQMDIDLTDIDEDARLSTLQLNEALRGGDRAEIEITRDLLNDILGNVRKRVLDEIRIRNKWQISDAERFMIQEMVEKARDGDPFVPKRFQREVLPTYYENMENPDRNIPETLIGALDTEDRAVGRHSNITRINLTDREPLYLVTYEDTSSPTREVRQEFRDRDGRVVEETGPLRDSANQQLGLDQLRRTIPPGGSEVVTIGAVDRTISVDTNGRLVETVGPEVSAAGGETVYLDQAIITNGDLQTEFIGRGVGEGVRLANLQQDFRDNVQNRIGRTDSLIATPDMTIWRDQEHPGEAIEIIFGNWMPGGMGATRVEIPNPIMGAVIPPGGFRNFGVFDAWITDLPDRRGRYLYASIYDQFNDWHDNERRHWGRTVNNMEVNVNGSIYEIFETDGRFRRRLVSTPAGRVPTVEAEGEDLTQGFNRDIQENPDVEEVVLATKEAIGRAITEQVFNSHMLNTRQRFTQASNFTRRLYRAKRFGR